MGTWLDSEVVARQQLKLSDDYKLEVVSIEVSNVDISYQEEVWELLEDEDGFSLESQPETIVKLVDKHITYIRLPAGMFLVKMAAEGQPDVWGFVQQEEQKSVG